MSLTWTENWQRAYRISIGTRETTEALWTINASVVQAETVTASDYETIPSNARQLSNLTEDDANIRGFTFKLDATHRASEQGSDGESSYLDLYGIDEDLISVIKQEQAVVIVEAGYQDSVEIAYTGDITKVQSFRQGTDVVHRIHCKSGANDFKNTHATLNYDEDMSEQDIILDMFGRLPNTALGTYGLSDLASEKKTGGRGFTGSLVSSIDAKMAQHNLNWCHFNGKIVIIPYNLTGDDYDLFSRTNYNLTADHLKKVTDISDTQGIGSSDTNSSLRKLQVNTFFLPIEIGQFITIPKTDYTSDTYGTYQVKGRRVILESYGNAWDTVLEVEELQQ